MLFHVQNQPHFLQNTWQEKSGIKRRIIAHKLIITRKSLCNLSKLKLFAESNLWIITLKNKSSTNADIRLMNSWSVFPLSFCVFKALSGLFAWGGSLRNQLCLMPSDNSSLGAGERGPGTNVAIMLMVRITEDSHYWHKPVLLSWTSNCHSLPREPGDEQFVCFQSSPLCPLHPLRLHATLVSITCSCFTWGDRWSRNRCRAAKLSKRLMDIFFLFLPKKFKIHRKRLVTKSWSSPAF